MSGARMLAEMPILDSSRAQTADGGASVLTRGRRSWQGTIAGIEDFKAGMLERDGELLRPRREKGLLRITSNEADGLHHLIWQPRVPDVRALRPLPCAPKGPPATRSRAHYPRPFFAGGPAPDPQARG
jgi:hypothetical protein